MGTRTVYPDTNCQYAYKTDRACFLRRIQLKAEELWMDGYRVRPMGELNTFLVYREVEGLEAGYKVNPVTGTCTCKFLTDQYQYPLDPADPGKIIPCKHLKGLKRLIDEEVGYFKGLEHQARQHPHNEGSRRRADGYSVTWAALQLA